MKKALSAFDLDQTLLTANSSFLFCRYLCKKGIFPLFALYKSVFYYLWHTFFGLSLEELHKKAFDALLKGYSLPMLQQESLLFVQEHLEGLYYAPAMQRLKQAKERGEYTVVLSSSPSFLVKPIAEVLGVDEWEASEYVVDKDLRLCQIQRVLGGHEKAVCVGKLLERLGIDRKESTAYSDSHWDLPFLQSTGRAVAVQPSWVLRRVANKLGWEKI